MSSSGSRRPRGTATSSPFATPWRARSAPLDRDDLDRLGHAFERLRPLFSRAERGTEAAEGLRAHQDLARRRSGTDPRRDVHALAAVVARIPRRPERAARVGADAHVRRDDLRAERALDRDRGVDRGLGVLERREEAVAGLLHDLAASLRDALANELVVAGEQSLPLVVP